MSQDPDQAARLQRAATDRARLTPDDRARLAVKELPTFAEILRTLPVGPPKRYRRPAGFRIGAAAELGWPIDDCEARRKLLKIYTEFEDGWPDRLYDAACDFLAVSSADNQCSIIANDIDRAAKQLRMLWFGPAPPATPPASPRGPNNETPSLLDTIAALLTTKQRTLLEYLWNHPRARFQAIHAAVYAKNPIEDASLERNLTRLNNALNGPTKGRVAVESKGGYAILTKLDK